MLGQVLPDAERPAAPGQHHRPHRVVGGHLVQSREQALLHGQAQRRPGQNDGGDSPVPCDGHVGHPPIIDRAVRKYLAWENHVTPGRTARSRRVDDGDRRRLPGARHHAARPRRRLGPRDHDRPRRHGQRPRHLPRRDDLLAGRHHLRLRLQQLGTGHGGGRVPTSSSSPPPASATSSSPSAGSAPATAATASTTPPSPATASSSPSSAAAAASCAPASRGHEDQTRQNQSSERSRLTPGRANSSDQAKHKCGYEASSGAFYTDVKTFTVTIVLAWKR